MNDHYMIGCMAYADYLDEQGLTSQATDVRSLLPDPLLRLFLKHVDERERIVTAHDVARLELPVWLPGLAEMVAGTPRACWQRSSPRFVRVAIGFRKIADPWSGVLVPRDTSASRLPLPACLTVGDIFLKAVTIADGLPDVLALCQPGLTRLIYF